jgi:putative hemolysin
MLILTTIYINISSDYAFALKNPAYVYCTTLGYEYITFQEEEGVRGACDLPNNPVDAWAFLKGKTTQEYSYCLQKGYKIKTVVDREKCKSIYSDECAVCILMDGTEVEVTKLMNLSLIESDCGDGFCASVMESFRTCPKDCPSGGYDGYCDGIEDGICDRDCLAAQDKDCVGLADRDGDGISDSLDNCPDKPNPDQMDADNDGAGNVCDTCLNDPEKVTQGICGCGIPDTDADQDGTPDCHDACPLDINKTEPGVCGCGKPDRDTDGDGVLDCIDSCPNDPNNDSDQDGVCGDVDNCPNISNSSQADSNGNGIGDVCEPTQLACDLDKDGNIDINDVKILLTYRNKPVPPDLVQCDMDGDGIITVLDSRKLVLKCTWPRCATSGP